MALLFPDSLFSDFGPSQFVLKSPSQRAVRIDGAKPSELRAQVRLLAPNKPGVYGMLDGEGQLLYVGKAKSLRKRLQSYFRRKGRPPKAGKLIARARHILWESLPSEFASLLRELELIRRWRPPCNVQGQPLRRRLTFVCVGRSAAPYLFLSRKITRRVQSAYGPILAGRLAREAVRRLSDWFRLRDCPSPQEMIFPDQGELYPEVRPAGCLRMEVGTCSGPCTGTCARAGYHGQVAAARGFLTGADVTLLEQLQREMQAAAAAQQFERAASLRDRWAALSWLNDRLQRARRARREMTFIYPVSGCDGTTWWYFIHGARTVHVIPEPPDEAARRGALETLQSFERGLGGGGLLDSYEHADSMMLVMTWFRRHPRERERCLCVQEPL